MLGIDVKNKTIIGLKSKNYTLEQLTKHQVKNKTIIGLKFRPYTVSNRWCNVKNKTIIGLK